MKIESMEDFRECMRSVVIRTDVEAWNLAVRIKNELKLRTVFDIADLPNEQLAPYVAKVILENSVNE